MISDFVYNLCHEQETVSSRLVDDPDDAPGLIAKDILGKRRSLPTPDASPTPSYDLDRAFECGKWGGNSRPSDLFLKVRGPEIPVNHSDT